MIQNESSMPYLLSGAMTAGLGVLLAGVTLGSELVHDEQLSQLAEPLQLVGGAVIVIGVLVLARYFDQLPDQEAGH